MKTIAIILVICACIQCCMIPLMLKNNDKGE